MAAELLSPPDWKNVNSQTVSLTSLGIMGDKLKALL